MILRKSQSMETGNLQMMRIKNQIQSSQASNNLVPIKMMEDIEIATKKSQDPNSNMRKSKPFNT